jgi:hypothetical protein
MTKVKTLAILNLLAFIIHLIPSQLTQFGLLNSQTIGDVSDHYPTLFTPAGVTFAIWGIIYLALTVFCFYHLIKAFKADVTHQANIDLTHIGYLFIVNNLATGLWTIAWVYELLLLSVFLMLVQLATLLLIQFKLNIYDPTRTITSRWFTQFPLSIYFGWICIATIANVSATLVGFNWNGFGMAPIFWTILMIIIAVLLTIFVVLNRRNLFVGMVTIWALYGIVLKHLPDASALSQSIIATCWVGIIIMAMVVIYQIYRNNQLRVL